MSTNTLSKEAEIRLMNFFNEKIDPDAMAKALRQVNFNLALGALSNDENVLQNATHLSESIYWLNELAETLNPYLEVE
ncbi:MAG: hypothetical protein ABI441_16050 [Flavobacterium sp.]